MNYQNNVLFIKSSWWDCC